MTLTERAAYLKGMMEGMKFDTGSDEGKLIAAIVDLLGDVAQSVKDIEETTIAISDELDEIEDDLDAIEDCLLDDEDEDDLGVDFDSDLNDTSPKDDIDFLDSTDEDDADDILYHDDEEWEVTCPKCGEVTHVDEDTLLAGKTKCSKCGEPLEFEFDDDDMPF